MTITITPFIQVLVLIHGYQYFQDLSIASGLGLESGVDALWAVEQVPNRGKGWSCKRPNMEAWNAKEILLRPGLAHNQNAQVSLDKST